MESYREYLRRGEEVGSRYALAPLRRPPRGRSGSQMGKAAGSSLEFREFREYQPGDDLRRLDWGAYARSDKLIIRLYQEEVQPHLDLVLDGSQSMDLEGTAKAEAALGLAALFATAASQAHYSHNAWLTDSSGCVPIANGSGRASTWQKLELTALTNPSQAFASRPPQWRPRSIRIFVSDLLWMGDPRALLASLSDQAATVIVVQLLSRQDVAPEPGGFVQLVDSETGHTHALRLDAESIGHYQSAFRRHQQLWHEAARKVGATLLPMVAEQILDGWKLDPLLACELLLVKS